MYKVCVVTATRAEYGLLRPLLFKLRNHPDIELCLVVTGAHLSELYGNTQKELITDGFNDFLRVEIPFARGCNCCSFAGDTDCAYVRR